MQIDYLRCADCTKKLPTTTDHDCMWKTRWQSLNHKLATIQNNLKNKIFELKQQNLKMSEERTVFQTMLDTAQKEKEELEKYVKYLASKVIPARKQPDSQPKDQRSPSVQPQDK